MQLKDNVTYDLVVPTSMGVRITPMYRQAVHCSDMFYMQATSAETNTASILSYLNKKVLVLTKFVKDSPIAEFIKHNLRSRGFEIEAKEIFQGGPWGYRHQFNIADMGYGVRAPRVHNDRAGEVGATLSSHDFDFETLFYKKGVQILHLSGLIAAISKQTGQLCLDIIKYAKETGTIVSFDMNYRESFWVNREIELQQIFTKIAQQSDIIVAGTDDFFRCLNISLPHNSESSLEARIIQYQKAIDIVKKYLPYTKIFATSIRETQSANLHIWGSIINYQGSWHYTEPRPIEILDRIGGGDAFTGGLLYGILNQWEPEKCLQFAWSCGALAVTSLTDYVQPFNEEQIWSIWQGNARIIR